MSERTTQTPSIGRVVHFVMLSGKHRPATIVEVWPGDMVNLQVMMDGPNDPSPLSDENAVLYSSHASLWRGSVLHDEDQKLPNTWHWPEYVPPKEPA